MKPVYFTCKDGTVLSILAQSYQGKGSVYVELLKEAGDSPSDNKQILTINRVPVTVRGWLYPHSNGDLLVGTEFTDKGVSNRNPENWYEILQSVHVYRVDKWGIPSRAVHKKAVVKLEALVWEWAQTVNVQEFLSQAIAEEKQAKIESLRRKILEQKEELERLEKELKELDNSYNEGSKMLRGFRYEVKCEGTKTMKSADTFKTASKALTAAECDFRQFRKGIDKGTVTIYDEDGKKVKIQELRQ